MTIFTVVWTRQAEDELMEIWLASTDRPAITEATATIDRELRIDPDRKGTTSRGSFWSLAVFPLRVVFEVHPADRLVKVLSAQRA